MFDWQVTDESHEFPDVDHEPAFRRRPYAVLLAAFIILLIVAAAAFVWRAHERQQALHRDIRRTVLQEEQVRRFGLKDQAGAVLAPGAPQAWRTAYRRSFVTAGTPTPVDVDIDDVTLDGENAYVTLRLNDERRLRAYRLVDREWLRRPVPAKALGSRRTSRLTDEIDVQFRAADTDFVQQLIEDLPALLVGWPRRANINDVVIEAHELEPALIGAAEGQVVLNSPLIVAVHERLGSETSVRAALADALLENPEPLEHSSLNGAMRVRAAIRQVLILKWAATSAEMETLQRYWQERATRVVGRDWWSPFYPETSISDRSTVSTDTPAPIDASALLVAAYLYDLAGAERLVAFAHALEDAQTWAQVLHAHYGRHPLQVEMAAFGETLPELVDLSSPPFEIRVLQAAQPVSPQNDPHRVRIEDTDREINLQAERALVYGPNGTPVGDGCVGLFRDLVVEDGHWLDASTFRATVARARSDAPADVPVRVIEPAPAATRAYLSASPDDREGQLLIAIADSGDTRLIAHHVAPISSSRYTLRSSGRLTFLYLRRYASCGQVHIHLYTPATGELRSWRTPPAIDFKVRGVVTHPTENKVLFVLDGRSEPDRYVVFDPNASEPFSKVRTLPESVQVIGWHPDGDRLIAVRATRSERRLVYLDLATGDVAEEYTLAGNTSEFTRFEQVDDALFYLTGTHVERTSVRDAALYEVDLHDGDSTPRAWFPPEEKVEMRWSHGHSPGVVLFEHDEDGRRRHVRVIESSDWRRSFGFEIGQEYHFVDATLCSYGLVLMTLAGEAPGSTSVRLWDPLHGDLATLMDDEGPVYGLACS